MRAWRAALRADRKACRASRAAPRRCCERRSRGDVVILRRLGRVDYAPTFAAMQEFTAARDENTVDELWLCEHPPVFTQGLSGKPEHLLKDIGIAVVQIDRGGQITYHGPGQVVVYLLLDLRRRALKVRDLVRRIEQAVIDL